MFALHCGSEKFYERKKKRCSTDASSFKEAKIINDSCNWKRLFNQLI